MQKYNFPLYCLVLWCEKRYFCIVMSEKCIYDIQKKGVTF